MKERYEQAMLKNAIHCIKMGADLSICEDCSLYPCDHTKVEDLDRVVIKALEKQILKKPKIVSKCSPNAFNGWYDYHCPMCNQKFGTTNNPHKVKFCYECGQAIDWE